LPPRRTIEPALGITGGISSGVANFGIDAGSSDPPGRLASTFLLRVCPSAS
jgi:hypothetical protein